MNRRFYFWPHGLTLVIILFVLSLVAFFIYMQGHQTDLVTREYYKDQIAYQKRIEQIHHGQEIDSLIHRTFKPTEKELVIEFDPLLMDKPPVGSIYFYRPSESGYDREWSIAPDAGGRQILYLDQMAPGFWRLKIAFSRNGTDYYLEDRLDLP
jgi:hypothetical protein